MPRSVGTWGDLALTNSTAGERPSAWPGAGGPARTRRFCGPAHRASEATEWPGFLVLVASEDLRARRPGDLGDEACVRLRDCYRGCGSWIWPTKRASCAAASSPTWAPRSSVSSPATGRGRGGSAPSPTTAGRACTSRCATRGSEACAWTSRARTADVVSSSSPAAPTWSSRRSSRACSRAGEWGLDALLEQNPALIVTSITDFGQDGPYRDYQGTDMVGFAMAGLMSRSGRPERPPLVAPGNLAYDVTGIHGCPPRTLLSFYQLLPVRRRSAPRRLGAPGRVSFSGRIAAGLLRRTQPSCTAPAPASTRCTDAPTDGCA